MAALLKHPGGGEDSAHSNSTSSSLTLSVSAQPNVEDSSRCPAGTMPEDPAASLDAQGQTTMNGSLPDDQEVERYFELCLNHDSLETRLGEINLTKIKSDGELFEKIKERYEEIRGPRIKRLYMLKPVDIHYVRVCPIISILFLHMNHCSCYVV